MARGRQLHRRPRARQRLVRPRHPSLGVRAPRPFLGKNFATTVGDTVVPLADLEPFRIAGPDQDPSPCPTCNAQARLTSTSPSKHGSKLPMAAGPCSPAPTTSTCIGTSASNWCTTPPMAARCGLATFSPAAPSAVLSARSLGLHARAVVEWCGTYDAGHDGSERSFLEDGDASTFRAGQKQTVIASPFGEFGIPSYPPLCLERVSSLNFIPWHLHQTKRRSTRCGESTRN